MPTIDKKSSGKPLLDVALVISSLLAEFDQKYVFPDAAKHLRESLQQQLEEGELALISSPEALAAALTERAYEILKDKHVRVYYSPEGQTATSDDKERNRTEFLRRANYAFRRVERLPGNIGYLDLVGFVELCESAKSVACATMTFLANTDALIIDLRSNGGGSPEMIAYLSSYFFSDEPVHLNSLYWRATDKTEEFRTHREVLGPRYGIDKPVFVLTSERTFSGAEEFAYNLQALGRARIVGGITGGGAHPGEKVSIAEGFYAWVSTGRAINPITKTNWEGVGVEPDILTIAEEARDVAHLLAIDTLLSLAPTDNAHGELSEARETLVQQSDQKDNSSLLS